MTTAVRKVYPDTEGAVKPWLIADPYVAAEVDDRVFFGAPQGANGKMIVFHRVGGGPDSDETPIDAALLQFDCWGEGQNRAQAVAVRNAVIGAIESLESGTLLAPGVRALSGFVDSVLWVPNPGSNQARYVVTAEIAAVATET